MEVGKNEEKSSNASFLRYQSGRRPQLAEIRELDMKKLRDQICPYHNGDSKYNHFKKKQWYRFKNIQRKFATNKNNNDVIHQTDLFMQ